MNLSSRRLAGLLLSAGLLIAACTTAATPIPPAGGGGVTVATGNSATLGAFLTGAGGKTLYVLTKDTANASTCTDKCATNWPPLTVPAGGAGVTPGAGVTGTFSTFARADGSMQVAINGKPLYYFAGDTKSGDTTGQGQGGVWFAAAPDGTATGAPAGGSPPAGSPSAEPTKGGYDY